MRNSYSLLSQEINDKLIGVYDHLVELLGYEDEDVRYSGILEQLDTSGARYIPSTSGMPSAIMPRVINILKFDYIYRTHYHQIRYLETKNA